MSVIRPTYEELQAEVARLKEENTVLRKRLALFVHETDNEITPTLKIKQPVAKKPRGQLSLEQKVELFRSLFVGRANVFARRWFSKATGKGGYQPVCLHEWRTGVCDRAMDIAKTISTVTVKDSDGNEHSQVMLLTDEQKMLEPLIRPKN